MFHSSGFIFKTVFGIYSISRYDFAQGDWVRFFSIFYYGRVSFEESWDKNSGFFKLDISSLFISMTYVSSASF